MSHRILFATNNPGKQAEVRALFSDVSDLVLLMPTDAPYASAPETGATFLENSLQKAQFACRQTGLACLAEDAGLEVMVLDGEPGVRSARFAGSPSNPKRNNDLLLNRMNGLHDRRARFIAVAVLCLPDGQVFACSGTLRGQIATSARGEGGFGYDPLFVPEGEARTLAEMPLEEKNRISHRCKAMLRMRTIVDDLTRSGEM